MVKSAKKTLLISHGTVSLNRKARFNYQILEKLEAGLVLSGGEVKALRMGRANISDAYAGAKDGMLVLFNMSIAVLSTASRFNQYEEKRTRELLLHKKEMNRLLGLVTRDGASIVPLALYFNSRGIAKVELGIARGKKQIDKRETIKKRDWEREQGRIMKQKAN